MMQHITNPETYSLMVDPDTNAKLQIRIPIIIEKLARGQTVEAIAKDLGIHRSNVYRTLRKVDFGPLIDLCLERAVEETEKIQDPKDKAWSYIQLAKPYTQRRQ